MVVADPMGHLLGFFATVAVIITLVYARALCRPTATCSRASCSR